MTGTTHWQSETTVSDDRVTVGRTVRGTEDEVIGTVELVPTGDTPLVVTVTDEFPPELPVQDAAFRSESAPDDGEISASGARIQQILEDEPVVIEYGILLEEPVESPSFGAPTVERVEVVDFPRSSAPAEGGPQTQTPSDDTASGLLSRFQRRLSGDESRGRGHEAGDAEQGTPPESEPSVEGDDTTHGGEVPLSERDDGSASRPEPTEPNDDEVAVSGHGSTPSDRRSVDVRLDRLSARIEKFTAYAEALEELIDEKGTASEIVDRLEGDLESLEEQLETLSSEVETVRYHHEDDVESVRSEVTSLKRRVGDAREAIQNDIDRIDDDLETAERRIADVGGSVEALDTRVDGVESDIDDVSSEVHSVDGRVDGVEVDVGHVSRRVESVGSRTDRVASGLGDVEADVERLDARMDGFEEDLTSVRASVESVESEIASVAADVHTIRTELETVRSDLDRLQAFRESMAEAFVGRDSPDPLQTEEPSDGSADAGTDGSDDDPAHDDSVA